MRPLAVSVSVVYAHLNPPSEGPIPMTERPWFRARESGLGWTPITWEGWLVTLASAGIFIAANLAVLSYIGAFHHRP